jgi:hypothetical protein
VAAKLHPAAARTLQDSFREVASFRHAALLLVHEQFILQSLQAGFGQFRSRSLHQ